MAILAAGPCLPHPPEHVHTGCLTSLIICNSKLPQYRALHYCCAYCSTVQLRCYAEPGFRRIRSEHFRLGRKWSMVFYHTQAGGAVHGPGSSAAESCAVPGCRGLRGPRRQLTHACPQEAQQTCHTGALEFHSSHSHTIYLQYLQPVPLTDSCTPTLQTGPMHSVFCLLRDSVSIGPVRAFQSNCSPPPLLRCRLIGEACPPCW